jgi:glucokinase
MAAAVAVGVDLGGTKCLAVAIDEQGAVVAQHRVPTPRGGDAVLAALAEAAVAVGAGSGIPVGVGAPGLVDLDGVLHIGANLPGARMLDLRTDLSKRLATEVVVDNDANCAAWGEYRHGAGRGASVLVVVTQGTGIGGGMVLDGVLWRGARGFGGEIGHMVVNTDGPPCPCGKRGCWERYASGSGLAALAREAAAGGRAERIVALAGGDAVGVRGEHVTAAAAEGDPGAIEVLERFGWWVALGLANLAELLDPDRFVLGGGLVEAGEVVLGPTRTAFAELVQAGENRPRIDLVPAALGEHAGAIGAAVLAAER